jgi:hypothetical protein
LISPRINLLMMLMKRIAIIIAAMILNAPILFSLGRMAFKSSLRSGGARLGVLQKNQRGAARPPSGGSSRCFSLSAALSETTAAPERAPVSSWTRAGFG